MIDILAVEELNKDYEKELWGLFVQGVLKSLNHKLSIPAVVKIDDIPEERAIIGKDVYISCILEGNLMYEARYTVPLYAICANSGIGDRLAETFCKSLEKYILGMIFKGPEFRNYDLEEFVDIHTGNWRK